MKLSNRKLVRCCGTHLGDVWASINYAILNNCDLSGRTNINANIDNRNIDVKKKIEEILPLLEGGDSIAVYDRLAGPTSINAIWRTPYVNTKIQWKKRNYGRVCYQFDGRSSHQLKNLSKDDEKLFFDQNYNATRLGGHLSLKECVEVAATSDLFIGVCSGMSHLCHSVGVPVYLIGHKRLHDYHTNKTYIYYKSMREFVASRTNFRYKPTRRISSLAL